LNDKQKQKYLNKKVVKKVFKQKSIEEKVLKKVFKKCIEKSI
jgi:hypothetical protein